MYRRGMFNRKILYCAFAFVFVALFTMTLAYAALSVTLNINGAAEIVASNWDIHLENPKVRPGSISNAVPTITGGNTMNFNVSFELPGQFYEFTVDVVNDGDIDAMIDNVIKTPELTEAQAKYIKYEISYLNGNSITESQGVPAKSSVPIKVRIEYRNDISSLEDLPSSVTSLSMSISLTYIQADETITSVPGGGKVGANGSLDEIGTIVTIGTEGENVKLLSMYNLYVGGKSIYPGYSYTLYGDEATGLQDPTMNGAIFGAMEVRGVLDFSTSNYWVDTVNEYPAYVYNENSVLYPYVENYRQYLEQLGFPIVEARLLSHEELFDTNTLACEPPSVDDDGDLIGSTCVSYPWLFTTSYWTGSTLGEDGRIVAVYDNQGGVGYVGYDYHADPYYDGVRPVIVIPKYAITGEAIPN